MQLTMYFWGYLFRLKNYENTVFIDTSTIRKLILLSTFWYLGVQADTRILMANTLLATYKNFHFIAAKTECE